ncbi:hypothetical protein Hdeb2414_s0009g00313821 [Helianthus debilis subsp. tardiflorus]
MFIFSYVVKSAKSARLGAREQRGAPIAPGGSLGAKMGFFEKKNGLRRKKAHKNGLRRSRKNKKKSRSWHSCPQVRARMSSTKFQSSETHFCTPPPCARVGVVVKHVIKLQ